MLRFGFFAFLLLEMSAAGAQAAPPRALPQLMLQQCPAAMAEMEKYGAPVISPQTRSVLSMRFDLASTPQLPSVFVSPSTFSIVAFESADVGEHFELKKGGTKVVQFDGSSVRSAPGNKDITSKIETMGGRVYLGDKIRFRGHVDILPHMSLVHNTEYLLKESPLSESVSAFYYARSGLRLMDVDADFKGSLSLEGVTGLKIKGKKNGLDAVLDFSVGPEERFGGGPVSATYWGEIFVTY